LFAPGNIKYNRVYIPIIAWTFILLFAAAAVAGNVSLSWGPPLTNEDGTTLTDLAGYKIYYGTSSGDYTYSIDAGNVETYQVNVLQERLTYYFTVSAYDTSGNESMYSNEVSRYILQSPVDGLPSIGQTCEGRCGLQSQDGCWCDDQCSLYGDCCPDYEALCLTPLPGDMCHTGGLYDCTLNCVNASDIASRNGDGICDNGTYGIDLMCSAFNNDGGDCSVVSVPACGTGADCPDIIDTYADLYQCDLSAADLYVVDLSYACLQGAVLTNANLHGASLMYADLSNADLRGAYMLSTDLTGANLSGADLTGAVLDNVIWWNTYCPDGTNSSNNNNTCEGHLF